MKYFYTFLVRFYSITIRIASVFNKKAELWVKGRHNYWQLAEQAFSSQKFADPNRKLAWFHCASLGEFEQGRPVLENFKTCYPDYLILLTFFSPSGYNVRKEYAGADLVLYLPTDTRANARRFIKMVKPDVVFWVKYEFWYNFLNSLHANRIPTLLISAIFRSEQHFFKPYGFWSRGILRLFNHIFVQEENSAKLLETIGIKNVTVSGDTRFDRVKTIVSANQEIGLAKAFSSGKKVLVAGSTWPADEDLLFSFLSEQKHSLHTIIAPHEINADHIQSLLQKAGGKAVLFSKANTTEAAQAEILIIDSIGMLSQLYRYGQLAYIGGGFGVGIHNILEAAAYGMPVFFGPEFKKFKEANDLIELQGAFPVKNPADLLNKTNTLLSDSLALDQTGEISKNYVLNNCGASEIILQHVAKSVLF